MIPLVGCRVEFISGPHAGKAGVVSGVTDYRTRLRTMPEHEAVLFVKGRRSTMGEDWASKWYEASVTLDGGAHVPNAEGKTLKVLTPELTRSSGYRSL